MHVAGFVVRTFNFNDINLGQFSHVHQLVIIRYRK